MKRFSGQIGCVVVVALSAFLGGCPVTQSQDTPVDEKQLVEPSTGAKYWLYVPSTYSQDRDWPLVVTLHGTIPWDDYGPQIREWKALAEEKGLIVVAPRLSSSQGIVKTLRDNWYRDLEDDERVIIGVMDDVMGKYRIEPKAVLLTGFSAGGFSMYHTGLRNPTRFSMLIARACNGDVKMLEDRVVLSDAARKLPIAMFWGKDDPAIAKQSWETFEYLRVHKCAATRKEVKGGHLRRPANAYNLWLPYLPERLRANPE